MKTNDLTDLELKKYARGWSKGDTEAFSRLYDYYIDNIYRFIYFKVKSEDAEDLTELVFIKAWENRRKYSPKKGSFSSWLYTIARNSVIDHYRVQKQTTELNDSIRDEHEFANPKVMTERSLNSKTLKDAINKLPDAYRDVLLLKFIEDMDYGEIAAALDKTEGAIRITQFRALRHLRTVLDKMGFKL